MELLSTLKFHKEVSLVYAYDLHLTYNFTHIKRTYNFSQHVYDNLKTRLQEERSFHLKSVLKITTLVYGVHDRRQV